MRCRPRAARPKQASPRERNKSRHPHNVDEAQTACDKSILTSIRNVNTKRTEKNAIIQ